MKMATLKATKRIQLGTRGSRRARKAGMLPGIIYGHGETPQAVSLDKRELLAAVHHGERLLQLDIDGEQHNVLVKEVQYDSMQQEVIHIDLARVRLDERVHVTIPIVLRGVAAGAGEGGVVSQVVQQANIECLVTAIPEEIRVSVADMKIGDVIRIKDLQLPQGVTALNDPEAIVCTVVLIAEEVVAAPEGAEVAVAGAEPEVIGAKKEEEGEEGAAEAPAKKEKKEE